MENADHARTKEGESDKNKKRASAAALVDAFVDEYRTDREHYNRRENHRVVREWLTIIFLFIAASAGIVQACIFIGQLHEMEKVYGPVKQQAEIANQNMKAFLSSERPVVLIESLGIDAKSLNVTYQFKNYGKTVARMRGIVLCLTSNKSVGYLAGFKKTDSTEFCNETLQPGYLIPPSQSSPYFIPIKLNGIGVVDGANENIVTEKTLERLTDEKPWIFVFGYFDVGNTFDSEHVFRQRFCYHFKSDSVTTPQQFIPTGGDGCWENTYEKASQQ
jgi:hypothetical protein